VNLLWLRTDSTESWLPAPCAVDDITGRIQAAVGTVVASDEAIRRVLSLETVAEMNADDRFLAWMLVTAIGADTGTGSLSVPQKYCLPTLVDVERAASSEQPKAWWSDR
jgi:hypothetical protein